MPAVGAAGSLWYTRVPRHRSRQLHAHHSPGHRGPACDRRAISVPLTPVSSGTSRLLADSRPPSSSWATRTIPAICKQGVRGSSPLSSTGQSDNSNSDSESTAVKYRNRDRVRCRTRVRVGRCPHGRRRTGSRSGAEVRATEQEKRLWRAQCRLPGGQWAVC
jgi:hypothetical protein